MNNFENSLLSELRTVVAEREPQRPLTARLRKPGVVALPVGALGAAAAAVVGFGALGGASAAYAVTTASNGDVQVTINSLSDAAGLQSQLRADGLNAYVDYTPNTGSTGANSSTTASSTATSAPGTDGTPGQHPLLAESVSGAAIPANAQQSVNGSLSTPIPGTSLLPANVQFSENSTTIDIPAADVNSSYKLDITTSGSTDSVAGLQLSWWN